jgi:hypothetical integral membrane protein (TIGR02206 family)
LIENLFSSDYTGHPFALLGIPHVAALATVAALNLLLLRCRGAGEITRRNVRLALAAGLWLVELSWHAWNIVIGHWSIRYMLPLNLCSVFIWLCGLMLILRSYRIYEFAYFLGIGAAIQYLATPDLGPYGFPHYRFFEAFLSHGLLLTAPIYMTAVEGFRPTIRSLLKTIAWATAYVVAIYFLNVHLGSDYLMVNVKPVTPSLLDLLPGWPYYVFYMELIGITTCGLLYLPFAMKDRGSHKAPVST